MSEPDLITLAPGRLLARGVTRHLHALGHASLQEFIPARGLRMDVFSLGPDTEFWAIECKSSRADFQSDQKWQGYLDWCDRYFWAVGPDFPLDLLPEESGVILADPYGAEILRNPERTGLKPARRKALLQAFARQAALRLARAADPRLDAP
ncbi:MAG: MmcB family DNA repair protein [Roseinatronobacter sp.]